MFSRLDGRNRTVCYILLVSLLCISALLLLTSESFGLKRLQLFPPNALRSHHPHNHHHSSSGTQPTWPEDKDKIIHDKADTGVKKLFAGKHDKKEKTCQYIEVVVPGDANTLAGTVAVVNSILQHTNQSVRFHLVVPQHVVTHLRAWLKGIPGNRLHYEVIVFPERLLKLAGNDVSSAEAFLAGLIPTKVNGRVIFINNDVIVQGDIVGMHEVPIAPHSFGAFLIDSHSASKHTDPSDKPFYAQQINMMNRFVRRRHVKGSRITFSGGAFVANLKYWRIMYAHRRLVAWLRIHQKMPITGPAAGATARHAAMLLVFYGRVTPLPPAWHLKGLGVHEKAQFSESFVQSSKLVHWSGHLKPWMSHAPFRHLWLKYSIHEPPKSS